MPKICGITTKSNTIAAFMLKPFNALAAKGFDCYVISNPDKDSRITEKSLGKVKHIVVDIKWGFMTPFQLTKTVCKLYKVFKKEKFDIIQYATMNAALCSSIAGWMAKVPVRINLLWGLDYLMYKGWKRALYYTSTKLICKLSTHVQPDSKGNLQFGKEIGLFDEKKGGMVYNGSACGLDLQKFDINKREEWRKETRKEVGLEKYEKVFGFVGILNFDKGIDEMLQAFMKLGRSDAALVLVGGLDKTYTLKQEVLEKAKQQSNIYFLGRKNNPEKYFACFDFHVLSSYAEGFGMVVLEAAGMGTPSIITNIKGPTDLIKDNVNGFVCEPKSVDSLLKAMQRALTISPKEYDRLAKNAHDMAKKDYDSNVFLEKYVENRIELYNSIKKNRI